MDTNKWIYAQPEAQAGKCVFCQTVVHINMQSQRMTTDIFLILYFMTGSSTVEIHEQNTLVINN